MSTASTQELIAIAQVRADEDTEHAYTQVPDFQPHTWVWLAMRDAYNRGRTDATEDLTAQQASQPAEQPRGEVLDAPAKVGVAHFGKGVRWATVIACAQRAYVHKDDPNLTDEQIAAFRDTFIAQPKPEQAASDDVLDALDDAVIDGDEEAVARISARLDGTEQAVGDGIVHAAQRVASFLDHANLDTSALPAGMGSALRKLRDALNAPRPAVAMPAEVTDEMMKAGVDAYEECTGGLSIPEEGLRVAIRAALTAQCHVRKDDATKP